MHADVAEEFVAKFTAKVGSLKLGLPWEPGVDLTPLPEPSKPQYLADLCEVSPATLPHYSPATLPHYSPSKYLASLQPHYLLPLLDNYQGKIWRKKQRKS